MRKQNIPSIHEMSCPDLIDEYFPKGGCKERGNALVLHARILMRIRKMLEERLK